MYYHKVQYYETDKMGITHHSNYLRWMEEARIHYLDELGYSFDRIENEGLMSPVLSINCNYKKATTFPENIAIETKTKEFKGVKFVLSYTMTNEAGDIVCTAESVPCLLHLDGTPARLKKEYPELFQLFTDLVAANEA